VSLGASSGARHARVTALCCSIAAAITDEILFSLPMVAMICSIAPGRVTGRSLDAGDPIGDILGRVRGLARERLDLRRHDSKALACLTCARCFDCGVKRQQVKLVRPAILLIRFTTSTDTARSPSKSVADPIGVVAYSTACAEMLEASAETLRTQSRAMQSTKNTNRPRFTLGFLISRWSTCCQVVVISGRSQ
jgi:hypothetical protein